MGNSRRKTVLCVGNDLLRLNRRCTALGRNGLRILSAGDGHEGILRVQQEVVDLVVLDLNDNGAEAALIAGELKRLHPKLPVIMLVPEEVTWAPEATDQADSVVTRSDDPSGLLAAVKASLLVA